MERVDAARPHRASWRDVMGEPFGRVREPQVFLILTVATLGVYPFYFHAAAHAELLQQLGRRNRDLPWLFASIGWLFFSLILRGGLWWVPLGASIVLFAFYVHLQLKTLHAAQGLLDLPREYHVGTFFLRLMPGVLILVGPFFAYKRLVEEYNMVWRAMAADRSDEGVGILDPVLDRVKALGSPASKPTDGDNPGLLASPDVVPKKSLQRSETHGGISRFPAAARAPSPSTNGHVRPEKSRPRSSSDIPDRKEASPRTTPPVATSPEPPLSGGAGRQGGKSRAFSVRDHRQWNRVS